MFDSVSYSFLQHYWWIIIAVLGAFLVFMFFVQGGQTLLYALGKDESERKILVNCLGRKWELTFTTLVTFGGAFFASFPLFYSTSFGGAYWVWIIILFCFIVQAVSYEFRTKPGNIFGHRTFEIFLFINGALGTILVGTAVSTFFTGSKFTVNFKNITNTANPVISQWQGPLRGLEAAFNVQNITLGLAVFFLARVLANLYFLNSIDHPMIRSRAVKSLIRNAIPFLVTFLTFLFMLLFKVGFAADPQSGIVTMEKFKYLHNLLQLPVVTVLFLAGVVLVLYGIWKTLMNTDYSKGIWFSGPGTFLVVFSLFLLAGFNGTAYYPSTYDLQSSLTIANSSSSQYTLKAMSYVSLFVPVVILYITWAWRSMNRDKMTAEEIQTSTHLY